MLQAAPTNYAKASGPKSCTKNNGPPLYNHRNPDRSDIPVQFYHSVFDTFLRRLNGIDGEVDEEKEPSQYRVLTEQLVPHASEYLGSESERQELIVRFLRFIGLPLVSVACDDMKTDGILFTMSVRQFLICNLEVKSDFPSGTCAYAQNSCYYAKLAKGLANDNVDERVFLDLKISLRMHSAYLDCPETWNSSNIIRREDRGKNCSSKRSQRFWLGPHISARWI